MSFFKEQTPLYEGQALLILGLMLLLFAGGEFVSKSPPPSGERGFFCFFIEGAVRKPGVYLMAEGSSLGQALQQAKPYFAADLGSLSLAVPLNPGEKVKLSSQRVLYVLLLGAVKRPTLLPVFPQTRCSDLLALPLFTPEADLRKLQKKRFLRHNDVFIIPERKKEQDYGP